MRLTVTKVSNAGVLQTSVAALSTGEWARLSTTLINAGSSVAIEATGFRHHALVAVWLAHSRLATWRANNKGAAQGSVPIPAGTHPGSYSLSVRAGGHRLTFHVQVVPVHLQVPPPPPTIAAIPDQSVAQQAPITPVAPSTTGQVSRFSASGLPPGLTIDPGSGVISGAPSTTGIYHSTVTANGPGGAASTVFTWTVGDPVVDAVGDMACAFADPNYNGGNGNPSVAAPYNDCLQRFVSDLVVNPLPSALLDLGDNQYNTGALGDYQNVFGPTFGRANAVTYPSLGNAEYSNGSTAPSGFFSYFSMTGVFSRIQATGGGDTSHLTTPDGYYSFNIGTWHIIALNSNCTGTYSVGGCIAGSPEEQWLKSDLAANTQKCILAYWHHPRWNSGSLGNNSITAAFWTDLYDAHATLVLNGHANHHYEHFKPQDPSGNPDSNGIREFIVSTGGQSHGVPPTKPGDASTVDLTSINYNTFGVLKLRLHPDSYDWQFVPASDGQPSTFTDSGSGACSS